MRAWHSHIPVVAMLLVSALFCLLQGADAAVSAETVKTSRVFVPAPPKGKGDKCVADTDYMRRYHMTMLDHQRDDTVHEGLRTKQFSLKECIACHAVKGPDAQPLTIKSLKHFCRGCHDYAAVKIDCFECHASRPEPGKKAGLPANHDEKALSTLAGYLGDKRQ